MNTEKQAIIKMALESKDFDERINEAVPHRIKINTELRDKMKDVRRRFIDLMLMSESDTARILKSGKKIKDENDRERMKEARRAAGEKFNIIKNIVHPNEGVKDPWHIKNIIEAFRILDFIDPTYTAEVKNSLRNGEISIKIDIPLQMQNEYFNKEGIHDELNSIVKDMDTVQGEICQNADEIKKTIFENVEDGIRKSKKNKNGISKSQFQKIVLTKANKQLQDKDKFEQFKEKISTNESNEIVGKQIVSEKVQTF